jgi:glutamyl-tRNA synthetase
MTAGASLDALQAAHAVLVELDSFDAESLEGRLRPLAEDLGLKAGQLFGILRLATTGKRVAPPLFGTLAILGKERVLRRLEAAEGVLQEYVDGMT